MIANTVGLAALAQHITNGNARNVSGQVGAHRYATYPTAARRMNERSAARRPKRSVTQPPGYCSNASTRSRNVPYAPTAMTGAPSASM
jgi:hypothetical protein